MTDVTRYDARVLEKIPNPPGPRGEPTWNSIRVGVFEISPEGERQIGEYIRDYTTLFRTFHHFRLGDEHYALYSRSHTATRVMQLPSCLDLGGEEPSGEGFCPVEYYVPCRDETVEEQRLFRGCGFVAGCIWGDDSTYKIQFLDLTRVSEGLIRRDDRFGYIVLPDGMTLAQAISTYTYDPGERKQVIAIATERRFEIETGADVSVTR